jgi:hypothetical protein
VCANFNGTEKRKLFVIGKSKSPRCFKNVKCLPVPYNANTKSWMTSDIFESLLRLWDRQLRLQNRKIPLLVDNCPAHPELDNLQNIKLVFLPANTTSVLQTMDQGVITSLKCHFRKLILLRMIEFTDKKQEHTVPLLHAIRCVDKAWRRVAEKTIRNCFRHAGITTGGQEVAETTENGCDEENDAAPAPAAAADDDGDLRLSERVRKVDRDILASCDLDAYVSIDDDVATAETQTEEGIAMEVKRKETNEPEEEDHDQEIEVAVPTLSETLEAIRTANRFYEARSENTKIISEIGKIEDDLEQQYWTKRKQKKITDFFV